MGVRADFGVSPAGRQLLALSSLGGRLTRDLRPRCSLPIDTLVALQTIAPSLLGWLASEAPLPPPPSPSLPQSLHLTTPRTPGVPPVWATRRVALGACSPCSCLAEGGGAACLPEGSAVTTLRSLMKGLLTFILHRTPQITRSALQAFVTDIRGGVSCPSLVQATGGWQRDS